MACFFGGSGGDLFFIWRSFDLVFVWVVEIDWYWFNDSIDFFFVRGVVIDRVRAELRLFLV